MIRPTKKKDKIKINTKVSKNFQNYYFLHKLRHRKSNEF